MAYKQASPKPIEEGGTEQIIFAPYSVIITGEEAQSPFQDAEPGTSGNILASNGPGSAPSFQAAPISELQFEPRASDPANEDLATARVWYNSTTDVFKGAQYAAAGAWTTITSMSTGRRGAGAAGTGDSCIVFGGYAASGYSAVTESWDGTSWSTVNSLNTARNNPCAVGTPTSAMIAGGRDGGGVLNGTETWNGTSWSAGNNLNTARAELASAGDASSALSIGGYTGSASAVTESWNGTSWSSVNSLNTARYGLGAGGSSASAVSFGGHGPLTTTETWDGANWSAATGLSTARDRLPSGTNGTSSLLLAASGFNAGSLTSVEKWTGSSWSAATAQNTTGDNGSICGNTNSIMQAGANVTSAVAQTYTDLTIRIFNYGAWATVNSLNTARRDLAVGGAGDTSDALAMGGFTTVVVGTTERWNGTSWSAVSSLNTAVNQAGGCGTAEDAIIFGGSTNGAAGGVTGITETYSGTGNTWTTKSGTLSESRINLAGAGTQSDALSFNGYNSASTRNGTTDRYNLGSDAWTNKGSTSSAVNGNAGAGSANDALTFGGLNNGGTTLAVTELFDGSGAETWSSRANMNTAKIQLGGSGAAGSSALAIGGFLSGGPATTVCEEYNRVGNVWIAAIGSLNTARRLLGSAGDANSALAFGGLTGSGVTAVTEEYTR